MRSELKRAQMVPTADLVMLGSLGKGFKKLEGLVFATTFYYKQTLVFDCYTTTTKVVWGRWKGVGLSKKAWSQP